MGTGSFPGVENGRGVMLIPHPLLVPRSEKQSRAIPLLSIRAFVACKKCETYLLQRQYVSAFLRPPSSGLLTENYYTITLRQWNPIDLWFKNTPIKVTKTELNIYLGSYKFYVTIYIFTYMQVLTSKLYTVYSVLVTSIGVF
jgi:hypothetical protein